jgi:hypothetical protein
MGIFSHLSTCVCTQSPKYLEMAQRHISLSRGHSPACFSPPSNWWSPSWVTTGEGMQPGCLMKILEAERWLKGTNFREVAFLQRRQDERTAGTPHLGLGRWKDAMHEGSAKTWLPSKGVTLLLKATLPTCVLSRRRLSLHQHARRSSPYDTGVGSHASCKLTQGRRRTAARGARNCPAVTSTPPLSPRPAGERADRHAGGMQPYQGAHPFDSDASSMGA